MRILVSYSDLNGFHANVLDIPEEDCPPAGIAISWIRGFLHVQRRNRLDGAFEIRPIEEGRK